MTDREANIHTARAYLAEAQRRRGTLFAVVLLAWAASARRRAAAEGRGPRQLDLL